MLGKRSQTVCSNLRHMPGASTLSAPAKTISIWMSATAAEVTCLAEKTLSQFLH
jgi:hypothetical protein